MITRAGKEGQKAKSIEETMTIIHLGKNHKKINTPEGIEMMKAATYRNFLNDVIRAELILYILVDFSLQLFLRMNVERKILIRY